MKIQNKIFTIVISSVLGYGLISIFLQYNYLKPEFNNISESLAQKDVIKSIEAINRELEYLSVFTQDYAIWDASYSFINDKNKTYIEENIPDSAMTNAEISFVALFNLNHELVYGKWAPTSNIWRPLLETDHMPIKAILDHESGKQYGLLNLNQEIYLLSIHPIMHTDGTGPINGQIIFGKSINSALSEQLLQSLNLHIELFSVQNNPPPVVQYAQSLLDGNDENAKRYTSGKNQFALLSLDEKTISGYTFINDLKSEKILLLQTFTDKSITVLGKKFNYFSISSLAACGLIIATLLLLYLRQVIIQPLKKLTKLVASFNFKINELTLSDDLMHRTDEIGNLAQSIQSMEQLVIEKHNEILTLNKQLDAKVVERTHDLVIANDYLKLSDTILSETCEGVLITDANMNIIRVNDAFLKMTQYERDELLGKNPLLFKSDRHSPFYYQKAWTDLQLQLRWSGEFWGTRKDGTFFPNLLSINAIKDEYNTITHYVGVTSDISQIKETEQVLEQLAYYDTLTGLPNRDLFYDRLNQALKRTLRLEKTTALLFIDLDRFKIINDTLGHATGDEVLIEISKRLKHRIRETDTVSRLGGDEFTIILEDITHLVNAKTVADDLIKLVNQPIATNDRMVNVGASIGIAMYPDDDTSAEGLMRKADAAMYMAKETGRGKTCFSSLEIELRNQEALEMESSLREAISLKQFELYLQPKVCIVDGATKVSGAEALIRWRNSEGIMVAPDQFIGLAEETGLIHPIGKWVLEEACRFSNLLRQEGIDFPIGVNLSVKQLERKDLIKEVSTILDVFKVKPHQIQFELTENLFLKDINQTKYVLDELKALGHEIAIDDFGKGYSSMSYIGSFDIDYLKIDKAFVDPLGLPNEKELVSAIMAIAKTHNFKTIAEGVETEAQKEILISLDCTEMQGYLFSKPLPFDTFLDYMKKSSEKKGYAI